MNEMRKLIEAVESAQGDRPVAGSQTYNVEYTVTVNVPVDAADQDEAEDKFFDYLFSTELQMDHNFGLDLGEVTITPQLAGNQIDETEVDQMETDGFEVGDLVRIVGNSWDSLEDELEEYQSRKYQGKVGRVKFPKGKKGRRRGVLLIFGLNRVLADPEDLELVKKAQDE